MKRIVIAVVLIAAVLLSFRCAHCFGFRKPATFLTEKELGVAALSPDGRTIVFSLATRTWSRLYRVGVDGGDPQVIPTTSDYNYEPVFSPDGSKILFCRVMDGQGDLCVVNLDGSGETCLTFGPENDYSPVYSADGSKIYFLRAKAFRRYSPIASPAWHETDIFSMNADGTELKAVTSENSYRMTDLSIDSKGDTLMIFGPPCDKDKQKPLWMIPVNEPANRRLVRPNLETYRRKTLFVTHEVDYEAMNNARFSPDGAHILFSWPFSDELFLMDVETNVAARIWKWDSKDERHPSPMCPRFSPDGRQVIFHTVTADKYGNPIRRRHPQLWIINVDGTGLRPINIR
jgi:Tol biopolymer transport system component